MAFLPQRRYNASSRQRLRFPESDRRRRLVTSPARHFSELCQLVKLVDTSFQLFCKYYIFMTVTVHILQFKAFCLPCRCFFFLKIVTRSIGIFSEYYFRQVEHNYLLTFPVEIKLLVPVIPVGSHDTDKDSSSASIIYFLLVSPASKLACSKK